ncbi:LCP family protein [Oceanobacillus alkalisoli]|uniref:LCP family protein n=1 Tax=Oceanobacillus alkalisoli TaxID=2925113 RepID=UPI001F120056|nr:LCP family protein [Oceanobacillus alkalisoli]MCF3942669.1 LCP family protein [Oceanobacillus alkalisoli]
MSRKKKIIITVLVIVGLAFTAMIGYAAYLYNEANNLVSDAHEEIGRENEKSALRTGEIDPVDDHVSILFIGVDSGEEIENDRSRSDALLLATFNKDSNTVKLLSIPRDSYVHIPEVGYYTKINHAHAFGGARATVETVEDFLNVPVDYYVRVNFNAFVDLVDAIDGIWYNVPYEISEPNSGNKRDSIRLYPGYQHLDGEETLALARTRKYDSDIQRGERQQKILKAIADEVLSTSSLLKLDDVMTAVGRNMSTNLRMPEIRGFFSYALDGNIQIDTLNLDGIGDYMADGGWYFQVDEESRREIQETMRRHLDLEPFVEEMYQPPN